ncbi:MAG: hypothetical protein ACRC6M_17385 [Microcystaceae cyanobacterium]
MRDLIKTLGIASLLGVSALISFSSPAGADTGSAITGDTGTGNQDSSSFSGGNFDAPGTGGNVILNGGSQSGDRALPRNWSCNLPLKNEEGSLRFKTVATMLATNLAGSESLNLLEAKNILPGPDGQPVTTNLGPTFNCAQRMAVANPAVSSRSSEPTPVSSNQQNRPALSGAALLGEIRPNTQVLMAAASDGAAPAEIGKKSVSLIRYFNTPAETSFPFVGKSIEDSLVNDLRLPALSPQALLEPLPQVLDLTTVSQDDKSKILRDLLSSLQGLTWDKTLLGDVNGESPMNVDQLVAAVKNYNDLINALSFEELQAWASSRYGQDITASMKALRTTCNCGWSDAPTYPRTAQ